MPGPYVVMGCVAALAALAVPSVLLVTRRRGERREAREPSEAEDRALASSGLAEVLVRGGFVRQLTGRFVRGEVSIRAHVRTDAADGRPVVYAWDVCVDDGRPAAAFDRDFVGRARRGAQGVVSFDTRVEASDGGATVKRPADPTDHARFHKLIERHTAALVSVTFDAVELFNHREARLHVRVRAPAEIAAPEALERVVAVARALHADARS